MYTNGSMTIYNKYLDKTTRLDAFKKTVIDNVFWDEKKASNRLQSGLKDADQVLVLIPFEDLDMEKYVSPKQFKGEGFTFKVGDRIVRGSINYEITKGADLDKEYEAYTITSVDKKDFGSSNIRHFEVGAE